MSDTTPLGRVRTLKRGELRAPGVCALCGNATCDRGYLDPDIFLEWEGNIYFCMNCVDVFITVIGCLTVEESEHLRGLNQQIAKELKETKEKLDAYSNIEHLVKQFASIDTPDGSSIDDLLNKVEQPEPTGVSESSDGSGVGESGTKESTPKQGPVRPKRPQRSNINL